MQPIIENILEHIPNNEVYLLIYFDVIDTLEEDIKGFRVYRNLDTLIDVIFSDEMLVILFGYKPERVIYRLESILYDQHTETFPLKLLHKEDSNRLQEMISTAKSTYIYVHDCICEKIGLRIYKQPLL